MPTDSWAPLLENGSPIQPSRRFGLGGRSGIPPDFPTLGAKAAVARNLVPALKLVVLGLDRWAPSHDRTDPILQHSAALLVNLARFYDVINSEGPWLSEEGSKEAHDSLLAVGAHHQFLCHRSAQQKRKLFGLTEKSPLLATCGFGLSHLAVQPEAGLDLRR